MRKPVSLLLTTVVAAFFGMSCSKSEQKQDPAAANTEQKSEATAAPVNEELKIGQTMPYSGPASAYGALGKVEAAYFAKINREGGINGKKKVNLISLDDSYSPPRAVEQTRKLVEQEKVTAIFSSLGTAPNSAIHKYLNQKEIPHLFLMSGASKWADPKNFPWTMGFTPNYQREGKVYAEHIVANTPKAKIAVLYQNDDFGKDLLEGLKHGLGDNVKMIVAEASYEASDPTVDSQIVTLKGSKADTLVIFTTPKFGAQAIRKVDDLGWKPKRYITNTSASVAATLTPAGLSRCKGLITGTYTKDPQDKQWENDPDIKKWLEFMKTEMPQADVKDGSYVVGYLAAQVMEQVLKQCDGDYSAKNIMKQAANLKNFTSGLLQQGIAINTSETDYELIDTLNLSSFDGERWAPLEGTPAAAAATK